MTIYTYVLRLDVPSFDELLNIVTPTMVKINTCENQLHIFRGFPLHYAIWPLTINLKTQNSHGFHLNKLESLRWRHVFCSTDRQTDGKRMNIAQYCPTSNKFKKACS